MTIKTWKERMTADVQGLDKCVHMGNEIAELRAELEQARKDAGRSDWRTEAVKWIRRKAEEQRATNEQYPRHAESYPSWVEKVRQLHWLADDLEREQESSPFGLDAIDAAIAKEQTNG